MFIEKALRTKPDHGSLNLAKCIPVNLHMHIQKSPILLLTTALTLSNWLTQLIYSHYSLMTVIRRLLINKNLFL